MSPNFVIFLFFGLSPRRGWHSFVHPPIRGTLIKTGDHNFSRNCNNNFKNFLKSLVYEYKRLNILVENFISLRRLEKSIRSTPSLVCIRISEKQLGRKLKYYAHRNVNRPRKKGLRQHTAFKTKGLERQKLTINNQDCKRDKIMPKCSRILRFNDALLILNSPFI